MDALQIPQDSPHTCKAAPRAVEVSACSLMRHKERCGERSATTGSAGRNAVAVQVQSWRGQSRGRGGNRNTLGPMGKVR